jgi:hypothetical protein
MSEARDARSVSSQAAGRTCSRDCRYFDVHSLRSKAGDCRAVECIPVLKITKPEIECRDRRDRFEMVKPGPLEDIPIPGGGFLSVSRGHETKAGDGCPYQGPYHHTAQIEADHLPQADRSLRGPQRERSEANPKGPGQ